LWHQLILASLEALFRGEGDALLDQLLHRFSALGDDMLNYVFMTQTNASRKLIGNMRLDTVGFIHS
jgi:hypothetical protein